MHFALIIEGTFGTDSSGELPVDSVAMNVRVTCDRCGGAVTWPRLPLGTLTREALVDLAVTHSQCGAQTPRKVA